MKDKHVELIFCWAWIWLPITLGLIILGVAEILTFMLK